MDAFGRGAGPRRVCVDGRLEREQGGERAVGDDGIVDEVCELIEFAGAAEDIDVGVAFKEAGALALGHAADDADDQIRPVGLAVAQLAEAGPDFLLGMDSDPASRNVLGVIAKYPELARDGIELRKFGLQLIESRRSAVA